MVIKCKKTKRFLCELNYDNIVALLRQNGVELSKPLEITIPCKNCKQIEVYNVYENHYVFKENIDKNNKKW